MDREPPHACTSFFSSKSCFFFFFLSLEKIKISLNSLEDSQGQQRANVRQVCLLVQLPIDGDFALGVHV